MFQFYSHKTAALNFPDYKKLSHEQQLMLQHYINQTQVCRGSDTLRGQGGPRPKIIFNVIFVEGRQSYQMLFTGSTNIDPSRIYRIFKIAKYIQLPCGRTLYSRLSQNLNFDTKNLSLPTVFELET